jgi:hypothetical protein
MGNNPSLGSLFPTILADFRTPESGSTFRMRIRIQEQIEYKFETLIKCSMPHLVAGLLVGVHRQIRGTSFPDFLLGIELWVRVPGVSLHQHGVPGLAVSGRAQDLHLVGGGGTHHHRLQKKCIFKRLCGKKRIKCCGSRRFWTSWQILCKI